MLRQKALTSKVIGKSAILIYRFTTQEIIYILKELRDKKSSRKQKVFLNTALWLSMYRQETDRLKSMLGNAVRVFLLSSTKWKLK